jgi:hypothetical protein
MTVTGDGQAERVDSVMMTAEFLDVLGAKPHLGRWFVRAEEEAGAPDVNVHENAKEKRKADKTKPKELCSEDWFYPQYFESRLQLFVGVERTSPERFRVVRSQGTGLDASLSLYNFERVNLRPVG